MLVHVFAPHKSGLLYVTLAEAWQPLRPRHTCHMPSSMNSTRITRSLTSPFLSKTSQSSSLVPNTFQTKYHNSTLRATRTDNMPLVVPGINSGGANAKTDEWMNKLVGKKLGEGSDATVSFGPDCQSRLLATLLIVIHRPSQSPSCPRRLGSSSQARWFPKTSSPRGMCFDAQAVLYLSD